MDFYGLVLIQACAVTTGLIRRSIQSLKTGRFDLWKKRTEIGYGLVWRVGLPVLI